MIDLAAIEAKVSAYADMGTVTRLQGLDDILTVHVPALIARIRELESQPANPALDAIEAIARELPVHDIEELTTYALYLKARRAGMYV